MPHIYPDVKLLQNMPKVDGGESVRLVQHFTGVGPPSTWQAGERVLDAADIAPGTVIANFTRQGQWPDKAKGRHAALFVEFGPRGADGRPAYIVMMEQRGDARKKMINARSVLPRGRMLRSEGNRVDDADNAEHFYVVR